MLIDNFVKQLQFDLSLPGEIPVGSSMGIGKNFLLRMDDKLIITLRGVGLSTEEPGQGYEFSCTVGKCSPTSANEELYLMLLSANLFGQGTKNGVLSLDSIGEITLSRTIPEETNYVEFKEHLEEFLNYAEYWQMKLSGTSPTSTASSEGARPL